MRRWLVRAFESSAGRRLLSATAPLVGASRFAAGPRLEDALRQVAVLRAHGMGAVVNHLGEAVRRAEDARAACDTYGDLLAGLAARGVSADLAVKPSHVGLDLSAALCQQLLIRIATEAGKHGTSVRLDMEDSSRTQAILDLFVRLRQAGIDNVGIALQCYLHRTPADLASLDPLAPDVRLVKGAYAESPRTALLDRAAVADIMRRLFLRQVGRGFAVAVATHDTSVTGFARKHLAEHPETQPLVRFEFLLGIRTSYAAAMAQQGYDVRIYVPFGPSWEAYLLRRMLEHPANLLLLLGR